MVLGLVGVAVPAAAGPVAGNKPAAGDATTTPIKHLVVIFQENVSFDHYFGTYPNSANTSGQPFDAAKKTPAVNTLLTTPGAGGSGNLLTNNPNLDANGNQVNPRRLDPANINDVLTCSQDHAYNDEQKAFDNGAMDKFVASVGTASGKSGTGQPCRASDTMNYYDGNTVTAVWNYAQNFAMSDNSFGTTFGPSTPGAINLVSGNTGGIDKMINGADTNGETVPDGKGGHTIIEDPQPYYDDCSTRDAVSLTGQNVGDLLNAAGLSWGWFQGGFRPTTSFAAATGGTQPTSTFTPDQFKGKFAQAPATDQGICNAVHPVGLAVGGIGGTAAGPNNYGSKDDYIPHHEPFQYYASTANPHHLPPASLAAIGTDTQTTTNGVAQFDTANHQYDTSDFDALVAAIDHGFASPDQLPAVSFLKAPGFQDGHAGYSDPIDEQQFVVQEINALQHSPAWSSTAVVVAYDDSDGWYDHVFSGIHNTSDTSGVATPPGPQDFLTGNGVCGDTTKQPPLAGENGRCGYGPRLPLLVVSPWAKPNAVDHTLTDQSSIARFIEDNWSLPRIEGSFDATAGTLNNLFDFRPHQGKAPKVFLDPVTGQVNAGASADD
jgi:phospholipase C